MKSTPITVEYLGGFGSDLEVVNAARVSFDKFHETFENEKDEKLIRYLAEHGHWSPFTHNSIQVRIKAPIFLARQFAKHQVGANWNEVSRRYVDDKPEFWWPEYFRKRSDNKKQGSVDEPVDMSKVFGNFCDMPFYAPDFENGTLDLYKSMLNNGVAPEQARMILPQNMMTTWIWTGSLYFFTRVINERLSEFAQKDCEHVARPLLEICKTKFPVSTKYLCRKYID